MTENDDIEQSWVGLVVFVIGLAVMGIGALFKRWRRD